MTAGVPPRARIPLMLVGFAALLISIYLGLVRMGWQLPMPSPTLTREHAPLMVSGFLGTLIGIERAVALDRRWAFAGPALTATGSLVLVLWTPTPGGPWLIALGSAILVVSSAALLRRRPGFSTATLALGAALWTWGNILWVAGWSLASLMPWWAAFLVVTIAGERWELSRLMPRTAVAGMVYAAAMSIFVVGVVLSSIHLDLGMRTSGIGLLLLAAWLLRNDVARRSLGSEGLGRFMGTGLLAGFAWLALGGALWVAYGGNLAGYHYDAMVHAIFLGFVFSMIFAHAPVIFPSVAGGQAVFSRSFYGHLSLLHASLLLRVAGNLTGWLPGRQWGGMLNAVAILLFLAVTISTFVRTARNTGAEPRAR